MVKFLRQNGGQLQEDVATKTSGGAADADKIIATGADGYIDPTLLPPGLEDIKEMVATETMAAGTIVNIVDDGGTAKIRKADASNGRLARGFILSSVTAAASTRVYFEGKITGLSGLTIDAPQYLSATTAGTITETATTTAGNHSQEVGYAISSTELSFEPQKAILIQDDA